MVVEKSLCMLFCCKCVLFVGVFQKNLFTNWADESNKVKCTMYNFINWVSLNQWQMSRNHNSSMNGECSRKKKSWKFATTFWIIEAVSCL